jgi:ATP-dependent Clp protease ATP-binding subunit ClpA
VIKGVVDKFLTQLQAQLDDKKVHLLVDESARGWLAEHGYDESMGARPMARLIQEEIKKPLAEEVLFGSLCKRGGKARVSVNEDKLVFDFEAA